MTAEDSFIYSLEGKQLKLNDEKDVAEFVETIKSKKSGEIREIRFSGNTFGVGAARAISSALAQHADSLRVANLSDIFTGRLKEEIPLAINAFGDGFLTRLRELDLCDNAFGPAGAIPLAEYLGKAGNLEVLKLQNNGLGPQGGKKIAEALTRLASHQTEGQNSSTKLSVLIIGRNRLENDGAAALGSALKLFRSSLKELVLPQNGIRPAGIASLIDGGLIDCENVTRLDFQDNTFTEKGSEALARGLASSWKQLSILNVGDCLLGKEGSVTVAKAFRELATAGSLPPLSILNLQFNEMEEDAASILAQSLIKMTNLSSLFLNGNSFDPDGTAANAIRSNLKHNQLEHVLDEWDEMDFDEEEEESEDEAGGKATAPSVSAAFSNDDLTKAMNKLSVGKENGN